MMTKNINFVTVQKANIVSIIIFILSIILIVLKV